MSNPWPDQPAHPQAAPAEPFSQPPATHDVVQAGFIKRWAALFLDNLIVGTAFYAIFFVVFLIGAAAGAVQMDDLESDDPPAWMMVIYVAITLLYYVAAGLYYSLMESSRHQATVGKMALGIKVVDRNGARLSFIHALGRWFAAALSYITLYIGFLLAAFTQKKQALHDMVAGTYVVDKWAYTESPERQQRGLGGCAIAFAIGMALLIGLAILGIIAAIALPAYKDYATRAQFAGINAELLPLRLQVVEAVEETGNCPSNSSAGFKPANSYATSSISRIVIDEFERGFCGISVWMPPANGTVERQFLAEYDISEEIWYCTDKADLGTLPDWCN